MSKRTLICEDCGVEDSKKTVVEETVCPYAEEICGEAIDTALCDSCYTQRCLDI